MKDWDFFEVGETWELSVSFLIALTILILVGNAVIQLHVLALSVCILSHYSNFHCLAVPLSLSGRSCDLCPLSSRHTNETSQIFYSLLFYLHWTTSSDQFRYSQIKLKISQNGIDNYRTMIRVPDSIIKPTSQDSISKGFPRMPCGRRLVNRA